MGYREREFAGHNEFRDCDTQFCGIKILGLYLQVQSLRGFQPKYFTHFSSFLCVLHVPPISSVVLVL